MVNGFISSNKIAVDIRSSTKIMWQNLSELYPRILLCFKQEEENRERRDDDDAFAISEFRNLRCHCTGLSVALTNLTFCLSQSACPFTSINVGG